VAVAVVAAVVVAGEAAAAAAAAVAAGVEPPVERDWFNLGSTLVVHHLQQPLQRTAARQGMADHRTMSCCMDE